MENTQESSADIIAEMRRGTRLPGYWRSCDLNEILKYHADRLEAALKREKTEIEADALAAGGIVEAAAKRERGNLDALERACEEVLDAKTLKTVVAAKVRIQGELKDGEVRK